MFAKKLTDFFLYPCIDNPPNFRLTVRMTHH